MYYLISVLTVIVCVVLVLVVLVQNSKGGGLASNFASSNQVMGVRKTADFLEKTTWVLAISLLTLSLLASLTIPRTGQVSRDSIMKKQISNTIDPSQGPNIPKQAPAQDPKTTEPKKK